MRDRFPLLLLGALLLFGALGVSLFRSGARGSFAEPLSTYRSEPDGARALYLLAEQTGLPVVRLKQSFEVIEELPAPQQPLLLLGISAADPFGPAPDAGMGWLDDSTEPAEAPADDEAPEDPKEVTARALRRLTREPLAEAEVDALLAHVRAGATLLYAPDDFESGPDVMLTRLDVQAWRSKEQGPRTLVPAQPTPYTLGVRELKAKVTFYWSLPEDAVPLLFDAGNDATVAAVLPVGLGRVLLLGAPELAMNRALTLADNARFWQSTLTTMSAGKPLGFDEFHHGFQNERSMVDFARRYGVQFAALQLLFGLCLWAMALRRMGRPQPPLDEQRSSGADALFATSRLYREGRHRAHAAQLIVKGVAQSLGVGVGLAWHAPVAEVASALEARGSADLGAQLVQLEALALRATTEPEVLHVAQLAATLRERGKRAS